MSEEAVTPSDLALIRRMEQTVSTAIAVQQFVSAHLATTYHLQPGDQIDDVGCITRAGDAGGDN